MTRRKPNSSFCEDMFNRADRKSFHLIYPNNGKGALDLMLESMKTNAEDERLPNKSIKELKAENKELADLKKRMLIK